MNYCPECNTALTPGATKCKCGWKGAERNEIMSYPQHCNAQVKGGECGDETIVAILLVRNSLGELKSGPFDEYGYIKEERRGERRLFLRGGYTFVGWVTRCARCYARDAYKRSACKLDVDDRYAPKTNEEKQEYVEVVKKLLREKGWGF